MNQFYVSNWRLLIGSFLAFIGSIVIASDKFPPVHSQYNRLQKWSNIHHAVADLDVFDYPTGDGNKVGYVAPEDVGFTDLAYIIRLNKPDLEGKIVGIAQNSPMALADVSSKIIHVVLEGKKRGVSVTTDFIFHEWIAKYRERFF